MTNALSVNQVRAMATERLTKSAFEMIKESEDQSGTPIRVFEDALSVVALCCYQTWSALEQRWPAAQGFLVEIMTAHLRRNEPKAWEGYLVLLSPGDLAPDQRAVDTIRRDTSRVRKIVATGAELTSVSSVDEALLPIVPIDLGDVRAVEDRVLDRLPGLLAGRGINEELATQVIAAFEENRSPMDAIWSWRSAQ